MIMDTKNKEQFKLLQYSDDSKSLSDLELTEIVVPRKRKVRRKTKPKNGHRHRKPMSDEGSSGACKNIGIWVAIGSNVLWLLILSYIVSMVHSEYSKLDKQQDKLSTSIKTLPDEWHDRAHTLEVNQSALFQRLFDLQQSMKNLTDDFMQWRGYVQQQTQTNNVASVKLLQKDVADFGANLTSLNSEIDSLKTRSIKFQEAVAANTKDIQYFQNMTIQRHLNETVGAVEDPLNKKDLDDLKNVTNSIRERLEKVNETFNSYATKVVELEKNHTNKINDLNDSVANITSQDVNQAMKNYQEKITALENRIASLEKVADTLEQGQKSVDQIRSEVDALSALQRLKSPSEAQEETHKVTGGEGPTASTTPVGEPPKGREGAPVA